jgi:protease IV
MSFSNWMRKRTLVYNPPMKSPRANPLKKWGHVLLTALKRLCMVLGASLLISLIFMMVSASQFLATSKKPELPKQMVVVLHLQDQILDRPDQSAYFRSLALGQEELTTSRIVTAIDRAASDKRVKALVLAADPGVYPLAQLQEIRTAIERFKATKKSTYFYTSSLGEGGSGLGLYYLASMFDQIWLQPVGMVSVTGMSASMPYFKNLLDRLGVETEFFQRKEYKSIMENATRTQMSPASREMMTSLLNDLGNRTVADIEKARPKLKGKMRALVDQGLFIDTKAVRVGLVDRVDYSDNMVKSIRKKFTGDEKSEDISFTPLETFLANSKSDANSAKTEVAVIHLEGAIMDLTDQSYSRNQTDSDEIARLLIDAAKNDDVRGIVLRLNSPGGSPTASEEIRRAVVRVREEFKKPIFVSMGNVAASGGYWVAASADRIYALPSTLTGSIGVAGGKFNIAQASQKLGVTWDGVQYGETAGMWSINERFSPREQALYEESMDRIYNRFVEIVAEGRKLPLSQAEQIARGRVWSGAQAKEVKLVDELGGLDKTLDGMAKKLNLTSRSDLKITEWPQEQNPFEALLKMIDQGPLSSVMIRAWIGEWFAPLIELQGYRLVYQPINPVQ